jgi:ring-1,2-phenylacetyl-CoA epoxidase subunit PaaC
MTNTKFGTTDAPITSFVLARADDALMLGHRLSEWCGHAPGLEEDLALANMALDLLGQARELYSYAAELIGPGATEDSLAYLRDVQGYRNLLMVELKNGDFGFTIMRAFLFSAFAHPYWSEMSRTRDVNLAAIADKSVKEIAYHLRYTSEWVIRLGCGTEYSLLRIQAALSELWPFTSELFIATPSDYEVVTDGIAVQPESVRSQWLCTVSSVFERANLTLPSAGRMQVGGRVGRHTEHLGHLLSDLQYLQRTYPGASW